MDAPAVAERPLLTKSDLPEIIQRYVSGESIQSLAADARRSRQQIYKWIHSVGDREYPEIVQEAMIARMADADHALSIADNMVDIARAREECRYSRWDLERRRPGLFGPKQEVKQDTTVTITVQRYLPDAPKQLSATPQPVVVGSNTQDDDE